MIAGLSGSAQVTTFNPYGVQKYATGDSLRLVGSQSGQYLTLPTTKMLRTYSASNFAKLDTTSIVGDIYNKSYWEDLSDFNSVSGFYAQNTKLIANSNSQSILAINYATCIDKYQIKLTYRSTNSQLSSKGLAIGFQSINVYAPISNYAYLVESGSNAGKIAIYSSYDNITTFSNNSLPSYNAGDLISIEIENLSAYKFIFSVKNHTKNTNLIYNLDLSSNLTQAFVHNTANPAILNFGGGTQYEISNISYSSKYKKGGLLGVGDSITNGSNASPFSNRWTDLISAQNAGGPGDLSQDVVLRLEEITKFLQPKTVYLAIGTNDINFDDWKYNFNKIVSTLEDNKINVIKLSTYPSNNVDKSSYANYINSLDKSIDIYGALKNSGTGILPIYDGGDGTHLSNAGHSKVADVIKSSPFYSPPVYYQILDKNILIPNSKSQIDLWGGQRFKGSQGGPISLLMGFNSVANSWTNVDAEMVSSFLGTIPENLSTTTGRDSRTNKAIFLTGSDVPAFPTAQSLGMYFSSGAGRIEGYDYSNSLPLPISINANGGNVGIGLSGLPEQVLHINPKNNTNSTTGLLIQNSLNGATGIQLGNSVIPTNNRWQFYIKDESLSGSANNYKFVIGQSDIADYVTILNGGNVGLGVSNPSEKLEISGNIKSTSFLGSGDRPVFAESDGTLKIGAVPSQVQNSLSPSSTTLAPSVDAVNSGLSSKLNTNNPTATGMFTTPNLRVTNFNGGVLYSDATGNINNVSVLPVSLGGTGVTASTGTGSVFVLNNAPTLINPQVGTQAVNDNSVKAASTAYADRAASNNVQNSLTPASGTKAASVDAVNAGLNTSANWKGESLAVTSKAVGDFIYYNGTNWINKQITATSPLSWNNTTGNMSFNDSGYAKLSGGNSFTGVQSFANGSVQPLVGFQNSGFINTLSSNTLSTNVSTYLPSNGGILATIDDLTQTVSVSATSQSLSPNRIYIPHNASLTTFSLPTTASEGQLFQIVGEGAGGWRIAQNASQQIVGVNVATTSGTTGYVQSTNANCTITIRCTVANSKFTITSSQGTLTIN